MLILLRILFGAALCYGIQKAWENAQTAPQTGDLANAFYLAGCVIMAVANAVVWAPYFRAKLSDPLAGALPPSTPVPRENNPPPFRSRPAPRGARRRPPLFFLP